MLVQLEMLLLLTDLELGICRAFNYLVDTASEYCFISHLGSLKYDNVVAIKKRGSGIIL